MKKNGLDTEDAKRILTPKVIINLHECFSERIKDSIIFGWAISLKNLRDHLKAEERDLEQTKKEGL
jgi:hypothetical protein